MRYQHIAVAVFALFSLQAQAADITRQVQQPDSGGGSFVDFGISLVTGKLPLVGFNDREIEDSDDRLNGLHLGIEARLEYKRFFIETIDNSFSNITLGYNASATEKSSVELIVASMFDNIERDDIAGLETITDRDGDISAGIRSSHYFGDSILQVELVSDIANAHNGVSASVQLGHQKQIRNWNVHGLVGLRYFSDSILNHYFGVSADEATASLPAYTADSGFLPLIQLGATKPLSEKWIFRTTAEYARLPDEVVDSPLAQGDVAYTLMAGVYYVFHGQ